MNKQYNPPNPWANKVAQQDADRAAKAQAGAKLGSAVLTQEDTDKIVSEMKDALPKLSQLWLQDAVSTRAKMTVYLDAGFTRDEAFAIVMKDRK